MQMQMTKSGGAMSCLHRPPPIGLLGTEFMKRDNRSRTDAIGDRPKKSETCGSKMMPLRGLAPRMVRR